MEDIIPIQIDGSQGAMVMQAAVRSADTIVYWDLDGTFLGFTEKLHEMQVSPKTGNHILTVTDSKGNILKRKFEILEK